MTPFGPLSALRMGLRRSAILGIALVGMTSPSVVAAQVGADPGPPRIGAALTVTAESRQQRADDLFLDAVASRADESPSLVLAESVRIASATGREPTHRAFREAERMLSLPASKRGDAARARLAASAIRDGVDVDALVAAIPAAPSFRGADDEDPYRIAELVLDVQRDRSIVPEAYAKIVAAVVAEEPTPAERRATRVRLGSNNGTYYAKAIQTRIAALVDHPSRSVLLVAAERANPQLDAAGAEAIVEVAGRSHAAIARAALAHTLLAFDSTPEAAAMMQAAHDAIDPVDAVRTLVGDGFIEDAEWSTMVPLLASSSTGWSPEADLILEARMSSSTTMSSAVRRQMSDFLVSRGYPIVYPLAASAAEVRDRNVTAPDLAFEALMRAAGRDGSLVVGIADGGFDVTHSGVAEKLAPNTDEIPGNHVDDDGDGYTDNFDGLNLMRMANGRPDWDGTMQGVLRTGISMPDHHGSHVMGIATRGSDRLSGALVAVSSGGLPEAFDYLAKEGARVVNFSMGVDPRALEETLAAIDRHPDILFVQAAGNDHTNLSASVPETALLVDHPRANLVQVAAVDEYGARLESSNWSPTKVGLAAPAKHLSYTLVSATNDTFGAARYYYGGQTSQASPTTANIAAKVRLLAPSLSATDVLRLLDVSSIDTPAWDGVVASGGVVDSARATALAAAWGLVKDGATVVDAVDRLGLDAPTRTFVVDGLAALGVR